MISDSVKSHLFWSAGILGDFLIPTILFQVIIFFNLHITAFILDGLSQLMIIKTDKSILPRCSNGDTLSLFYTGKYFVSILDISDHGSACMVQT